MAKQIKEGDNEMNAFCFGGCRLDCRLVGLKPLGKKLTPKVSSFVVYCTNASSVTLLPSNCTIEGKFNWSLGGSDDCK